MKNLYYDTVDAFVTRLQNAGVNVQWDGWSLLFHKPDSTAVRSPYGSLQNGQWGYTSRVEADSQGRWNIAPRWTEGVHV